MLEKRSTWWGFFFLGVAALFLFQWKPAVAQEPTPQNDANCVSCHEHRYYLYDSGKYYCLCKASMHCVYCHGGRTDSYDAKVAHEGMVLYPTRHEAEQCRECHEEDYLSRVIAFEKAAGLNSASQLLITATPGATTQSLAQKPYLAVPVELPGRFEDWQIVVLGLLALTFLGVCILGYRCWKADCLFKNQTSKREVS